MMRKRNLTADEPSSRKLVADFFGVDITEVGILEQRDTFSIYIKNNDNAKKQYKQINQFGNGNKPGSYNFDDVVLVMWNGEKVQPV